MRSRIQSWARAVKRDAVALWLAARDPRTPWYVKFLAGLVAAYALSPIDLMPDFIPILGYLDDLMPPSRLPRNGSARFSAYVSACKPW